MQKTLILFVVLIHIGGEVKSQLFSEKVTIYGVTLKAKEITGQKRFNSSSQYYRTTLLSPLIEKRDNEYLFSLGSYRRSKDRMETLDLFNFSTYNKPFPLIDTIDFHFYQSRGFDIAALRNPIVAAKPVFNELRKLLNMAKLTSEKKEILFRPEYYEVRTELLLSRYDILTKSFTVGKTKVTTSTAELKARIDSVLISNIGEASANIRVYLYSLADEKLDLKGNYYDARLSDTYIGFINYYIANTPKIAIGNDMFAFYLKEYINSETAAANTGLVAIQLSGTFDKTKVSKETITADLQSKFQIPADKATKIGAGINYSFTKDETTNLKTQFNSVFLLRYFTSEILDEVKFPEIKSILLKFQN